MEPGLTYIVRIYRYTARTMTGVVEDVSTGIRIPFSGKDALWAVLRVRAGKHAYRSPGETTKPSKLRGKSR